MIVCVCHRVSDRDITRHVQQGCVSFESLQANTGVATCCGCCESCAREAFNDAQARHLDTSHEVHWMKALPEAA